MRLEPFALERMQSTYENQVEFNLSESGVHPLRLGELVHDTSAREALLGEALRYTQTNGTPALRAQIASIYDGATDGHILVTNGGSEANFVTAWNLVEPGDEVVMMVPNYMPLWGLAHSFGATVTDWPLVNDGARWRIDIDALERAVSARTKMIIICNPNNPTGARFEDADLDRIAAVAARHGSWVLADEIYRGAERDGRDTATMWGRYDRVIVTGGLSKAYGLPGLRIGWAVAPPAVAASLWAYRDYTTIGPGALSEVPDADTVNGVPLYLLKMPLSCHPPNSSLAKPSVANGLPSPNGSSATQPITRLCGRSKELSARFRWNCEGSIHDVFQEMDFEKV